MTAVPLPTNRPTVRAVTVRSAGAGGCGPVSGPALIDTTHRPKETEMKPNRLAGHALPNEGRVYDGIHLVPEGAIRCSCGEWSPQLPSSSARKRWHREHKDAVRSASPPDNSHTSAPLVADNSPFPRTSPAGP